jgi:hypothetical protein
VRLIGAPFCGTVDEVGGVPAVGDTSVVFAVEVVVVHVAGEVAVTRTWR